MGKDLKGKELGEGITQRKNGTYMARYVNRFGERHSLYNKNLKLLKESLKIELSKNTLQQNVRETSMTLAEWHDIWLDTYKVDNISPSTKNYYKYIWDSFISVPLGKYKLKDISSVMVRKVIKNVAKRGLKYETQNKIKILIVDMFDKAIVDDYAIKNPARGIKLVRDDEIEPRVLTVDEQRVFFECAKGTLYYPLFLFAVSTGLRVGEIAALTKDDIDLKNNVVRITKTLTYQKYEGDEKKEFHLGPPKTKTSYRDVPLNKQALEAIHLQYKIYPIVRSKWNFDRKKEGLDDLVFTTRYGTPHNPQTVIDAISRIVEEINLQRDALDEIESFSCHCFRHTFATRCFEAGISPKVVQKYLGHATLEMTMDLYTHVMPEMKTNEMEKLENMLSFCMDEKQEETNVISFVG